MGQKKNSYQNSMGGSSGSTYRPSNLASILQNREAKRSIDTMVKFDVSGMSSNRGQFKESYV